MWKSELVQYLCYPNYTRECAEKRLLELRDAGVLSLLRVVGKGHSSIVLEVALLSGDTAALKILRTDSKRADLRAECGLMKRAYPVSPRVLSCGDFYILMELLHGVQVVEALREASNKAPLVLKVISAGRGLDISGIDHRELSRAHKHVLLTAGGKVKILDYESATLSERPRNVCRLVSWLIHSVLNLELEKTGVVELLREYKRSDEETRRKIFPELVRLLASTIRYA